MSRKPQFFANGPAIKAVCVGRRSADHNRSSPPERGQKAVTAQGGHGAVFGVMVQIFWRIRVSRYN